MKKEQKKAILYAYVGHNRGVAVDFEGKEHRNQWVKLNLELDSDETIEKLSWKTEDAPDGGVSGVEWGSNKLVVGMKDIDELVKTQLTLCDALFSDKEQKEAWKSLLRNSIHNWHDTKFARYNLYQ